MKSIIEFILERKRKSNDEKKDYSESISILDQITSSSGNKREQMINQFVDTFVKPNGPTIYAFVTNKVKDAIKVGYTDQYPEKRIAQWKEIYGKERGEVECLGYWSSEALNQAGESVFFWDHAIHKILDKEKGYTNIKGDNSSGKWKFFLKDLTDEGKKVVDLHYSKEFFSKYKRLLNGDLDPNSKEELSAQLLEDIIKQMKYNIEHGTADFKLYSFDKEGKTSSKEADKIWGAPDTYPNTDLQNEAIKNGVKAIKEGKKNILMAAVMRFGKTHASYEIVKQAELKRVIVCSAKADVRTAWREDINHVHFYKDFVFIEVENYKWDVTYCKGDKLVTEHGIPNMENLEKSGKTMIYFFTLHDLGGSVKELKEKHKGIFDKEFDMMIVDETHYGSHANTFGEVTGLGSKRIGESKEENNVEDDEEIDTSIADEQQINKEAQEGLKKLNIRYKTVLQVSGTPYYILASNEMIDKDAAIISKVSYSDMLNARDEWDKEHKDEDPSTSPYFGIPTLHKIGLRLTKECYKALKGKGVTDSLTELFKTKGDKFVYEDAVKSLMQSIFGNDKDPHLAFLANKKVDGNKICKHTMIVMPRVHACEVMKKLLSTFINTNERKIFSVVGNSDVTDVNDLNNKLYELDNAGKKSIILTCVRFLTGVSMPCVDSMIYLKNANSPQEYDQNIFRLCTRYVKNIKDPDEEIRSKKVNMKDNVYLIDFNIANMLKMVNNSARMKAAAEGNPTIERVKELMEDDLKSVPIFTETTASNDILGKMKKLDNKDLMQIYTGYNKNKSIADIVNDEIDMFEILFTDKKYSEFQDLIMDLDIEGDKSKLNLNINDEGDAEVDAEGNGGGSNEKHSKDKPEPLPKFIDKKDERKREQLTKEKFKAITKNLLYCNICLDEPCVDLNEIIKKAKNDDEFKNMLGEFKVSIGDLQKAYKMMGTNFQQAYNSLICRMAQLAQDKSMDGYEKFATALKGLGRLDKNEVVTPPEIVEKMINKLTKEDFEKAETILLVNEKQAEFFMGIYKKFGKRIASKCKIIPSSEIGKHLCKKMLKSIGIKNYFKNIINIEDIDGNGKYDVNDFLKMDNDKILEIVNGNNIKENLNTYYGKFDDKQDINEGNTNRKIDILLSNPPYARNLHMKFLEKYVDLADKIISIQPLSWLQNIFSDQNKNSKINKIPLTDVEYVGNIKNAFKYDSPGHATYDTGIYVIDNNAKTNNEELLYKFIDLYPGERIDSKLIKSIKYKILNYCKEHNLEDNIKYGNVDENTKYTIIMPTLLGNAGCKNDRYFWKTSKRWGRIFYKGKSEGKFMGEYKKKLSNVKNYTNFHYLEFETEDECKNWIDSQDSDIMRFISILNYVDSNRRCKFVPYMEDYSKIWTDDMLAKFFNITKDEKEQIHYYITLFDKKFNKK